MTVGKVHNRSRSCHEMAGLIYFLCLISICKVKTRELHAAEQGWANSGLPTGLWNCYASSFHFICLSYSLLPTYQAHRKFSLYPNECSCQLKLIIFSSKGSNPEIETSALRYTFAPPTCWGRLWGCKLSQNFLTHERISAQCDWRYGWWSRS